MSKYKKFVQLLDKYNEDNSKRYSSDFKYITNDVYTEMPMYVGYHLPPITDVSNHPPYLYFPCIGSNSIQSQYLLWQSLSEVKLLPELCEVNEPKPSVPVKISTCHIDVSVNNISDLLAIIDKYPLQLDTEYNIDLETLHKIKSELTTLDNMIGMDTLKQSIINQLLYFIQNLHVGTNVSDFKHTVIYGPPGTGKTEVARIIGHIYSKIGVLKKNIFKKVTRNDLIAGFLGQTAIKTKQVITDCLGGVLFIDEAYSLASNDQNDSYSKECLDILCEALSEHKDDLMVIIAGYENELNTTFFRANPGLSSRFIWRFSMQPYTIKELIKIFNKMVLDQEWTLDKDFVLTEKWFNEKKDNFSSYGRDIEALITYIKIAHGRRIYGNVNAVKKCINMDDLNTGYKQFAANKQPQDKQEIFGLYV